MQFEHFGIVHLSKRKMSLPALDLTDALRTTWGGFSLNTCQRWLWISVNFARDVMTSRSFGPEYEVLTGKTAYLFLLKLASGLESEVLGETDIFGQIKEAWHQAIASGQGCPEGVTLMSRLFEDTKEIRSKYLQNLGGASYGSLVRKVVRDHNQKMELPFAPVFLVGAGQIAASIAPFLLESELWIANRNSLRLQSFMQDLQTKLTQKEWLKIRPIFSKDLGVDEANAWKDATHTVIAVPADAETDRRRVQKWIQGGLQNRTVIHLGGHRQDCQVWADALSDRFFALDDLFSMQNSLGSVRSAQITQAIRACQERAQLRAMGGSLSIPHGWEDLACFA
jgi:hypothetical protein